MAKLNELELQSKTIDWLRFPLALLVIFIHMNPDIDVQNIYYINLNPSSLYDITGILVSKTIGAIAVPCFFMFSGFLFFNMIKEWNKTVYFSKVKTRLRTLVVPYILFNSATVVLFILVKILKADGSIEPFLSQLLEKWYRIFWNYNSLGTENTNILGQVLQPSYGPFVFPLWFLRDLIVMTFISPIIYYLVKYAKIWGLFVLFFCFYTQIWVEIPGYSAGLFLNAFLFFSIGAFFSVNKKNMIISLRKYQIIWFVVASITMFLSICFYGTDYLDFFQRIFILSGVISVVNITSYFMEREKLRIQETLSKASFFIYCTHSILILDIAYTFDKILGKDSTVSLLTTYFIVPFICVGIILCVYLLMKRFTPRFLDMFTGNR